MSPRKADRGRHSAGRMTRLERVSSPSAMAGYLPAEANDAAVKLAWLIVEGLRLGLTGVGLKDDSGRAALPGSPARVSTTPSTGAVTTNLAICASSRSIFACACLTEF